MKGVATAVIRIELSLRQILTIAGVVLAIWLLSKVWGVFVLAGVALMIAAALLPYVDWLSRRTHNRNLSVVLIVVGALAVLALVLAIVVPPLYDQSLSLYNDMPEMRDTVARFAEQRGWYDLSNRIRFFQFQDAVDSGRIVDTGRVAFNVVFALVTTFFLAAYFMVDAKRLLRFVYFSTPRHWHLHIQELLPALQRVVGGYIRGQAITSGAIAVFTFVMLTVMRAPNAISLAVLAAVMDLIPFVGAYIVFAIVVLATINISITTAVIAGALMFAYQQFEDRILIPRVYGATLRLPTIAVVLSILAGAELMGIVGAIVALPIASGVRVIVEYFAGIRRGQDEEQVAERAAPEDEPFAPDDGPTERHAGAERTSAVATPSTR